MRPGPRGNPEHSDRADPLTRADHAPARTTRPRGRTRSTAYTLLVLYLASVFRAGLEALRRIVVGPEEAHLVGRRAEPEWHDLISSDAVGVAASGALGLSLPQAPRSAATTRPVLGEPRRTLTMCRRAAATMR
jgi:hypothetical protein